MSLIKVLKLQFISLYRLYLWFIGICIGVSGILLIPFDKNNIHEIRTIIVIIYFLVSLIISFIIGNLHYNPIGKTYMQVQSNRSSFPLAVILYNIINLLIMIGLFSLVKFTAFFYIEMLRTSFDLFLFIQLFVWYLFVFTLGNSFCLFFRKYKSSYIAILFIVLILGFAFPQIFTDILNYTKSSLLNTTFMMSIVYPFEEYGNYLLVIFFITTLLLTIINSYRYNKVNIIKSY